MMFSGRFEDNVIQEHHLEIDSTQKHVQREFAKLPCDKFVAVSADFQTGGVGKGDRKWVAAAGKSVLTTYAFSFPKSCSKEFCAKNAKNVSHVLASSAVKVLRSAVRPAKLQFNLKWPNDIMVQQKKMGGILAEAKISDGRVSGIIIGIGLNINKSKEELDTINRPVWPATSLLVECPAGTANLDVKAVREALTVEFYNDLRRFCETGFDKVLLSLIDDLQILKGDEIAFNLNDRGEGEPNPAQVLKGRFEGIDDESQLVLILQDGTKRKMIAGEIVPLKRAKSDLSSSGAAVAWGTGMACQAAFGGGVSISYNVNKLFEVLGMMLFVGYGGRAAFRLPISPVPITAQTFCIQIAALFSGPKYCCAGMAALALHEIFASDALKLNLGSPAASEVSRGYILGFVPAAFIYGQPSLWAAADVTLKNLMLNAALGSLLIYVGGVLGLLAYGVQEPIKKGVIPFLPGDALKSFLAAMIFKYSTGK